MHYDKPPEQPKKKTREEQDEDFKVLSGMANKNCPTCYGSGKFAWSTKDEMYIPCTCLLNNLEKALEKREEEENQDSVKSGGVIRRFREMFGIN